MGAEKDQKVLILGAGGHAQVIADILDLEYQIKGKYKVIGYLDDDKTLHHQEFLGVSVLGSISQIEEFAHDHIIIAIGDNVIRVRLFEELSNQGKSFINAIHPAAVVSSHVEIGVGNMICAGVVVNPGTKIMDNTILNTGCSIDHHNILKEHIHIAPGCTLGGDVTIGEGTLIGIGATVLPQIKVGDWCVVGAGAVVTKDVKDKAVVVGLPAREITYG